MLLVRVMPKPGAPSAVTVGRTELRTRHAQRGPGQADTLETAHVSGQNQEVHEAAEGAGGQGRRS